MSILTDGDIIVALRTGDIVIEPMDPACLGSNSYDVHLHRWLRTYAEEFDGPMHDRRPLDCLVPRATVDLEIPDEGLVLWPGTLYLASTVEWTEAHAHVPFLEGKSSLGRLGMSIHVTAGKGDVGFCNHWTMEIDVVQPLRVYAGMPIGQLIWHTVTRPPIVSYDKKPGAKYDGRQRPRDPMPRASEYHRNTGEWRTKTRK